jgi:uncharacterized protein
MSEKRTLSAKEVVADIKAGLSTSELMKKYTLSSDQLRTVLNKLLSARLIQASDFQNGPREETRASQRIHASTAASPSPESASKRSASIPQPQTPSISSPVTTSATSTGHQPQMDAQREKPTDDSKSTWFKKIGGAITNLGKDCEKCGRKLGLLENKASMIPANAIPTYQRICSACLEGITFTCSVCNLEYRITDEIRQINDCPVCARRLYGCQECDKILKFTGNVAAKIPENDQPSFDRICWDCLSQISLTCSKCGSNYCMSMEKGLFSNTFYGCPDCKADSEVRDMAKMHSEYSNSVSYQNRGTDLNWLSQELIMFLVKNGFPVEPEPRKSREMIVLLVDNYVITLTGHPDDFVVCTGIREKVSVPRGANPLDLLDSFTVGKNLITTDPSKLLAGTLAQDRMDRRHLEDQRRLRLLFDVHSHLSTALFGYVDEQVDRHEVLKRILMNTCSVPEELQDLDPTHILTAPSQEITSEEAFQRLICTRTYLAALETLGVCKKSTYSSILLPTERLKASFSFFMKHAKEGNVVACEIVGLMFLAGVGVAAYEKEGIVWIQASAEKGRARAETLLALAFLIGVGVQEDTKKAASLIANAVRRSEPLAMVVKPMMNKANAAEQEHWYRKAAEQGDPVAQRFLASIYSKKQTGSSDYSEAEKWYRKAAEQGDVASAILCAGMILAEKDLKARLPTALELLQPPAQEGHPLAQRLLAAICADSNAPYFNPSEAEMWLKRAGGDGGENVQGILETLGPGRLLQ